MICHHCYSKDLRPSLPRWYDAIPWFLFGREPYRCRNCHNRQWHRTVAKPDSKDVRSSFTGTPQRDRR